MRAVAQMHSAIKAVEDDTRFSAEHKAKLIADAQESQGKAVAVELAAADAIVGRFDKADAAEALPPQLAATDALNIALDREVRDWIRQLDLAGQTNLARELLDGSQPRVLLALLRSPIKNAIQEVSNGYHANGTEVSKAKRETERVMRISRPVWRACKVVAAQMRSAMEGRHMAKPPVVALTRVRDWEMRLRHSMDVSWQDLPANHPKRMVDWRR